MSELKKVRPIAFYLPQYHPIPENDAWWGAGFTEWTNVVKATPLFRGHYQPHLPADLGFYDLRLPEVRQQQADLAKEYGIYGFCYYHYWFNGKRLLERPFNEVLASGKPDFPFCLCWANHTWNRVWDGQETEVLIKQTYSEQDDLAHIRWLAEAFQDKRYVRVDGKPIFLVYNPSKIPDLSKSISIWREEALRMGIGEILLGRVESFQEPHLDPTLMGFDVAIEFQPDTATLLTIGEKVYWRLARKLRLRRGALICDYDSWIKRALQQPRRPYEYFPCITPGWDNSARRKSGPFILKNSTPELYEFWLKATIEEFSPKDAESNLVFINAWNEWAEGNHLEPCQKWGRAYLEATYRAIYDSK